MTVRHRDRLSAAAELVVIEHPLQVHRAVLGGLAVRSIGFNLCQGTLDLLGRVGVGTPGRQHAPSLIHDELGPGHDIFSLSIFVRRAAGRECR
jgi:hypothetical protein